MRHRVLWLFIFLFTTVPMFVQDRDIDTQRSKITVHVGESGLLSAAAHNHTINAPIASGTASESAPPYIEFTAETAKMTVEPDPKVDAKDQATIQTHIEELTLETKKYPEIAFHSSRVERTSDGRCKVDGDLSLPALRSRSAWL